MKKFNLILIVIAYVTVSFQSFSQTNSNGFNFQGYAIDPNGKALAAKNITVRFSIYPTGEAVEYTEEIATLTDNYGVFSLVIGSVAPINFAKINFYNKVYKLKVEVKATTGGTYTTINDAQLQSVPYSRAAANGVPVGTIVAFAGTKDKIPAGWLACDGTSYAQSAYPQLYAIIGGAWGTSGANFNVPDLRGQFLRGVAEGQTADPNRTTRTAIKTGGNIGDAVGSVQTDDVNSHRHTFSGTTVNEGDHQHSVPADAGANVTGGGDDIVVDNDYNNTAGYYSLGYKTKSGEGNHTHGYSGNTGYLGGAETRPINAFVFYIIKY